ncbi:FimV/HubP family polar landmark protein [Thiohalobacter sp. IOR34]|uniref:FimV/HubP family polar landmark protein n=1 Tax=Thiohalobacter sp. IOR34 TaxID=3057176 RepID=UPI0025AF7B6E|nr:FimV/HubP family polar landmark protein [Thiohalobacter sp. IOR34]WJW74515.1 FimV/HubP family polar landmark protein [Thiohalobacter sp. IOR34]
MVRKTALVTAMLGAFTSQSYALGLGEIDLHSALNQPFDADIEVLEATPKELAELRVGLASSEAYTRTGLERIYLHTKLRFSVERRKDGTAVVHVSSREPIREPFLDFLIEASWGSGQVVREYTVLIDPPVLMPAPAPATQAATVTAVPEAKPRAAAPAPRPLTAPRPAAPRVASPGEYGPTQRNDTLWKVAERLRPDSGVSMEQVMLALLEANPEAFYDNNINNLKAGYVLRVPSREEMTAISRAEARREVQRQYREWRERRSGASRSGSVKRDSAAETVPGPAEGPATEAEAATEPAADEAQLKLVAPDTASAEGGAAAAGEAEGDSASLEGVRQELALAVEAVEAQRQQNQELNERLSRLEEQISQLHRLIQLKDSELASLQAKANASQAPAATASAPGQTQVAARSPAAEDDSLSGLLRNPLVQAAGAGVLVLFGLFAWLGARRRRMEGGDFQESILEGATTAAAGGASAAAAAQPAAPEPAEPAAPAEAPAAEAAAPAGPQTDSSLFTDFAVSDMGAIQNEAEADPLAEADVYLAYGRYQQAEELVKAAIEKSPDQSELYFKLLEIYYAARNTTAFDVEAEALLARLGGADDPMWERVAEMGRELNPANPLYAGGQPAAAPAVEAGAGQEPETLVDELEGTLDFSGEPTAAEPPAEPVAEADSTLAEEIESNSLDFDLGDIQVPGGGESEDESRSEAPAAEAEQGLDFDLTGPVSEETVPEATEELEEEGVLAASDEVATKLDLARAYAEMGDPEGARSILEEVLGEGNEAQKAEAESLIKQLS